MSVAMDLPSWRGSDSTRTSSGSPQLDKIIERLSRCETPDSGNVERRDSSTICNFSESSNEEKSEGCKCEEEGEESDLDRIGRGSVEGNETVDKSKKRKRSKKKKKKSFRKREKRPKDEEMCQPLTRINGEKWRGVRGEDDLAAVGGDGEENRDERSRCRQHELSSSSNEINRPDVIKSCDLTSKSDEVGEQNKNGRKDCPGSRLSSCSASQSTCSEGSYSRRKHHKHHKHKQKSKSPVRSEDSSPVSPKVNPIFLWVRQEDTRIVEVLCEDYDHRNRIRLTRTHLGWRAIPKTKRFAEVIIPKGTPKEGGKASKPKQAKKIAKRRKSKKRKSIDKVQKLQLDNPNKIKECSVALNRDDLANYQNKTLVVVQNKAVDASPGPAAGLECSTSEHGRTQSPIDIPLESLKRSNTLVKSNSCDFPTLTRALESLPRSISLDFKLKRDNKDFKVQNKVLEATRLDDEPVEKPEVILGMKAEPEVEKNERKEDFREEALSGNEEESSISQRNHSENIVMDMTKHDSDFNDTDCDELGQLLKDIPDLEFVEEEELEEVDEDEEWSTPTDLTLPKSTSEKTSIVKLPILPPNVTVTSSVRPPEPLTAPLPEVTITPIPNPKPAHQQKPQNNFLESLLSSTHAVKPETEESVTISRVERRTYNPPPERKTTKHGHENDSETDMKSKKLKVEDITLKNLLSKNKSGRTIKSMDLETCVQNMKMVDGEECSKSRLQELLTDGVSSGKTDPISQLKEVLSNPHLAVPDPLLVPRARLPALVASPASEIPRLLSMHLEKAIEETPCPPVTDSDFLEVSLSNLQSLLSCTPEKLKATNAQDLAYYQKSLETFLEWQRYQTELMEAQLKSSKSMSSGFNGDMSDVATANAFNQMLWLPYLNQFDFNCNNNRDVMSMMNSVLANEYQANSTKLAPPQINISQVPQPSPFLTPTSPMDIESQLKTLAMWQEAVMMQQNPQASRTCPKPSSTPSQDLRRSVKVPNVSHQTMKKPPSNQTQRGTTIPPISCKDHKNHLGFEIYQDTPDYQKKMSRQYQQRLEEHHKHMELQHKFKQEQQNQFKKIQRSYANYQNELARQCKVTDKRKPVPGSISVKPLSNLIEKSNRVSENRSSWEQFEEELKKNAELSRLQQFKAQRNHKVKEERGCEWGPKPGSIEVKGHGPETPKLKVKNLVDPNMSPPKLLKQIAPEHLPIVMDEPGSIQDDAQAHLWHPLFGSNQIKSQPYNSPWRWTTVTVNGE